MMVRMLILVLNLSIAVSFAQRPDTLESKSEFQRIKRVREFARTIGLPISYHDLEGNRVELMDVIDGVPHYYTTFNAGAAITTGASRLHSTSWGGPRLTGAGIIIGIWDGGRVHNHDQFDNRVIRSEGSANADDHGTHVAGTMMASGVPRSDAKGMAPEAQLASYYWDNDRAEMEQEAQQGLLLSNHSYGTLQGWDCGVVPCRWLGSPSVSVLEDFRFGFYSSFASEIDRIAYDFPDYLIVWAAGNDQDDINTSGNNANPPGLSPKPPPDCNGGTGFDCIGNEGTNKNGLTVGAVAKVTNYEGPQSVQLAGFSGTGPTDDGRIKPDLVAAGVSVLSTVSTPPGQTGARYATFNGTSMAAPNVTGSLALLQEYSIRKNTRPLKSSTVKALAIHTAREAGPGPGPDYRHGWGLLDVYAAANVVRFQNESDTLIREMSLSNGQIYEFSFYPQHNSDVTATLVWTDLPGSTPANALDPRDRMLVNDLDLRIVDDAGNLKLPWILDPDNLSISQVAARGDNFRDNVEKIEFASADQRRYSIRVSHKGSLVGAQSFSLILTFNSRDTNLTQLYWVGDQGNWSDVSHWSLTSGGSPAGVIPGPDHDVVFDENSFFSSDSHVDLDVSVSIGNFSWLRGDNATLRMNGYNMDIQEGLYVVEGNFQANGPGSVTFKGARAEATIEAAETNFSEVSFIFHADNTQNKWNVNSVGSIGELQLVGGHVVFKDRDIELSNIIADTPGQKTLDIGSTEIVGVSELRLTGAGLSLISGSAGSLSTASSAVIDFGENAFDGTLEIRQGVSDLNGNNRIKLIRVIGEINLLGDNVVDSITNLAGSKIKIRGSQTLHVLHQWRVLSDLGRPVKLFSVDLIPGNINFAPRKKLCFDFMEVDRVNVVGEAIINAGLNSTVTNSLNWEQELCERVVFPDFEVASVCVGGLAEISNMTKGNVESWQWSVGGDTQIAADLTTPNPKIVFRNAGPSSITLRVGGSNGFRVFSRSINVQANSLAANSINLAVNQLVSNNPADAYQWLRDLVPVQGATSRLFSFDFSAGTYHVLTFGSGCNRLSEPLAITSVVEQQQNLNEFVLYPNPFDKELHIESNEKGTLTIIDALGRKAIELIIEEGTSQLDLSDLVRGVYLVKFERSTGVVTRRLIKH